MWPVHIILTKKVQSCLNVIFQETLAVCFNLEQIVILIFLCLVSSGTFSIETRWALQRHICHLV